MEGLSSCVQALEILKHCEFAQTDGYSGMIRAESLFVDIQRSLIEGFGLRVQALGPVYLGEIVQAYGSSRMIRT